MQSEVLTNIETERKRLLAKRGRLVVAFAKAARSALGGGGSDLVNAGRWLHFMMMEKANDMSPVGKRGYRLTGDGWLLPWD